MTARPAVAAAKRFLSFVDGSPSPFHCVASLKAMLASNGYEELREDGPLSIRVGGKYFYTRNQSSLAAFAVGKNFQAGNGFAMMGTHTDSPNFLVKPISAVTQNGYLQVGVATYGGGIWHTWFDRDLTVAGRVIVKQGDAGFVSKLVHIKKPILRIP
jgi:aspartyl aminopeptidase